MDICRAGSN